MSMFTKVDAHGVKEYRSIFLLVLTLVAMAVTVSGGGYLIYLAESGMEGANVSTWRDGTWMITMVMTTIGFGDFYPVTDVGRAVVWGAFVLGALELGSLIGIASSAIGADKSIQNRELRTMLSELLRKQEAAEAHFDMCTAVNAHAHHLDVVFEQQDYSSKALRDGYLTIGKDSSGMYMMSVVAFDRETNQQYHRWLPASSREELFVMYKRYLEKDDEL